MVWIHGGGFVVHSSANYGDRGICKFVSVQFHTPSCAIVQETKEHI